MDDDGSVLVIILNQYTKPSDKNVENLSQLFSDPYFIVKVCQVDPPTDIPPSKTLTKEQYIENYYNQKVLTYAADGPYDDIGQSLFYWSKLPVIIVKDNSISVLPPVEMKNRISTSLSKAEKADLFYLCKWNDACNKYIDIDTNLKWSTQPTSTQAILYRPSARDYTRNALNNTSQTLSDLLNSNIQNGKLAATVFFPNIVDFDINLAVNNSDFSKLNECSSVQTTTNNTSTVSINVWIFVLLIIMILVAYLVIRLTVV